MVSPLDTALAELGPFDARNEAGWIALSGVGRRAHSYQPGVYFCEDTVREMNVQSIATWDGTILWTSRGCCWTRPTT